MLATVAAFMLALVAAPWAQSQAAEEASRTIIILNDIADPVGLDPHVVFDNKTDNILNQIYEGLVKLDGEGRIVPALAESWERVDAARVRFRLRRGVRFHSGRRFDAGSAAASIRRELASGSLAALQIATIVEVSAESDDALVIRTREPDGVLLHRLAAFARIADVQAGAPESSSTLAGTGPFRLASWDKGRRLILEANEGYWGAAPSVRRAVFEFLPEDRQISALLEGKADIVTEVPGTRTLEVARKAKVVKAATLSTHTFWFTKHEGPLASADVRRALNMAIDKSDLIRYAARGNGRALATFSMPGELGHNPGLKPYPYDPVMAKKMLASAGWPKGFALRALVISQSEWEAKVIQRQLRRVGVALELHVLPMAEAFAILAQGRAGDYDLAANLAPDPVAHIYFLPGVCLSSRSPVSAGGLPGFDERFDAMLRAIAPQEHLRLGTELDSWIHEQAAGLFTYQRIRTYGVNSALELRPSLTGMLDLSAIAWSRQAP